MERSAGPYYYRVFGESICSDIELWPGLAEGPLESPTLLVRVAGEGELVEKGDADFAQNEAWIRWPRVAFGSIRQGRILELKPDPRSDPRALALLVTGPMLGAALHQRGLLVLHGSCVADPRGAVCFVGPSGAGKSTVASALAQQGRALLSDGMTVLSVDSSGGTFALPGPAQARLWPDAARSLGWDAATLMPVTPQHDKVLVPQPLSRASAPRPLTQLFVVEAGAPATREKLLGSSALLALLKNHYLSDYVDRFGTERVLRQCADIASRIPVSMLRRGVSLDSLACALELVAEGAGSSNVILEEGRARADAASCGLRS